LEAGGLPDTPDGWRRYGQYLAWLAVDQPAQRARDFGRMCKGWWVGSADFNLVMQKELLRQNPSGLDVSVLGREGKDVQELREEIREQKLQQEAATLGINPDTFPSQKSAPAKVQPAAALKASTSASNGWLANRLQMGQAANVSQYVRRFHQAANAPK
jgi:hypothetical protein